MFSYVRKNFRSVDFRLFKQAFQGLQDFRQGILPKRGIVYYQTVEIPVVFFVIVVGQAPDAQALRLNELPQLPVRQIRLYLQNEVKACVLLVNGQLLRLVPLVQLGNDQISLLFIELPHPVDMLFKKTPA